MNIENLIYDLLHRPYEEEWFEFKGNWYEPVQLGEYISALSNAASVNGKANAYFIWGIDDKSHEIIGTDFNPYLNYKNMPLQAYLAQNLSPNINFKFDEVELNKKRLVMLTIPAAKTAPTSFKKIRYFRIGSSKISLENFPEREGEIWNVIMNGYPTMINTESPIQNLTFKQLRNYYIMNNLEFSDLNFEENLKLKTNTGKYNMLACFLADNGNIPVRVSIFSGKDKSSKLYSVKEFGNCSLIATIDKITEYGSALNIPIANENLKTGIREDIFLFEQDCFNEAVKNAFIHNNWLHRAAPMITFFEDRVEIKSFSRLAPNQTIEGFFRGDSKPVNEDLSVIFIQTHLSERSGKGVPLIVSKYGRESYEITDSSITVTLKYNYYNRFELKTTKSELNLNKTEQAVLDLIKDSPYITQPKICERLNLGKTVIQNSIAKLKKLKLIKRIGSNKNGYWEIN